VILSDHGAPNRNAALRRERIHGVILYGGSEAGLTDGHLVLFGQTRLPLCKVGNFPPDAVADIHEWGGRAVVAYPVEGAAAWQYWEPDFIPDGIELLNLVTEFHRLGPVGLFRAAALYPFSPYALLPAVAPPDRTREKWDALLSRGPVSGYLAVNAHGGIRLGGRLPAPFPSYEAVFRLVGLGVDRSRASDPLAAVREGDFFSIVRGAGEPQEFSFSAVRAGIRYPAGSMPPAPADLVAVVRTNRLRTRLVLLRDGRKLLETTGSVLRLPEAGRGAYRVEVYLPDHPLIDSRLPWICSNPILVGGPAEPPVAGGEPAIVERRRLDPAEFTVEKDDRSTGTYRVADGQGVFSYTLARHEENGLNRWCALARRRPLDLSGLDGVYLEADGSETLRYYVELRSGDRWYYASAKVEPGGRASVRIPFARFYRVNGGREPMPLAGMDSMFLSINNYNSATGFSARLVIRALGFYSTSR
jgi:hypothetical protein